MVHDPAVGPSGGTSMPAAANRARAAACFSSQSAGPSMIRCPFRSAIACAGPDGSLLLSESNGLVKQFNPEGELVEILGAANVASGCKNSSIGFSTDGSTLYYLDVQAGRVCVLEKRP